TRLEAELIAPKVMRLEGGHLGSVQAGVRQILVAPDRGRPCRQSDVVAPLAKALGAAGIHQDIGRHLVFQQIPGREAALGRRWRDIGGGVEAIEGPIRELVERGDVAKPPYPGRCLEIGQYVVRHIPEYGLLRGFSRVDEGQDEVTRGARGRAESRGVPLIVSRARAVRVEDPEYGLNGPGEARGEAQFLHEPPQIDLARDG